MNKYLDFAVPQSLTKKDILDILTTAIEGGVNYYLCLDNTTEDWVASRKELKEKTGEAPCYCDVAFDLMEKGKSVRFEDQEDHNRPYELTLENFKKGCSLYAQHSGKNIHKMIDESDFDAEDADCIIQFALFGELMYG